jgi:hypothetical protein
LFNLSGVCLEAINSLKPKILNPFSI